jgi:hypothetical protein
MGPGRQRRDPATTGRAPSVNSFEGLLARDSTVTLARSGSVSASRRG